ncbi:VOC family protein [Alkalihalobacillus macyae]|uniref:VOC family protein n=1 Tax=Guptibacillus hwajinpoensis TaxID=208199 RepID=UPI00273BFC07|nr:VOC family protein [Alkalihalobacillus macyae]MDP4549985.1 VOC family protein [Alkalihalobacillus macyae]
MIHHIELYVSDLKKSIVFWGWLLEELEYKPFQNWDEGRSWKWKESYIVLVQVEEAYLDAGYHRKRVGLNHLAFNGKSRVHVDHLKNLLEKKGIEILYKDKYPYAGGKGHYAIYFEDPDRIKVEVVAPNYQ